jgi:hypothetical protein
MYPLSNSSYLRFILKLYYRLQLSLPIRNLGLCVQKVEAADVIETSALICVYQTTGFHLPEDSDCL